MKTAAVIRHIHFEDLGTFVSDLSMGRSGDCEWAIEEGATVVRVGQAVFGARPSRDSHYWPG